MSKSLYTTIIEETAPLSTTVGVVGQLYLDSSTKILYQCVAINIEDLTYEWKPITCPINQDEFSVLQDTVNDLSPKVMRALLTPVSAPPTTELVAVDDGNSQTMIEIGEGLILENGSLKADASYPEIAADGVAKVGYSDRVIESFVSSDGQTWYRKWASGWKECGGVTGTIGHGASSQSTTMPVEFATIYYSLILVSSWGDTSGASTHIFNKTTDSFVWWGSSRFETPATYYACGY